MYNYGMDAGILSKLQNVVKYVYKKSEGNMGEIKSFCSFKLDLSRVVLKGCLLWLHE